MTNELAELAEQRRDLRLQVAELDADSQQEIVFQEFSPGRRLQKLWNTLDGMMIVIPNYMVPGALVKRRPDGQGYLFTADPNKAPPFKDGTIPCFLAQNSPERESGLLAEVGLDQLVPCPAEHLRSDYSKRMHAEHRHAQAWAILQEFIARQERSSERAERRQEMQAIRELAGVRSGVATAPAAVTEKPVRLERKRPRCNICGEEFATGFDVGRHKKAQHAGESPE